jgi:hypothetical protein
MGSVRWSWAVAAFALVGLVSACSGDAQTYSIDETKTAFAQQGYELEEPAWYTAVAAKAPKREGQAILAPRDDSSFFVVVATDSEADAAWPDYERQQTEDSFDARRANVGVFADEGVPPGDRGKVLAALEALPDRDAPVMVAGG